MPKPASASENCCPDILATWSSPFLSRDHLNPLCPDHLALVSETRISSARASESGAIFRIQEGELEKLRHELEGDGAEDLEGERRLKIKSFRIMCFFHLGLVVLGGHQVSLLGRL